LLPRWRGAAPIQRAIEAGDAETGITIMQMDEGLDTGDMLRVDKLPINDADTAASLHDALAELGAKAIVEALAAKRLTPQPQPAEGVTYAAKLSKAEALLNLSEPADALERRIRAFNPAPGAMVQLAGFEAPLKVWQAIALPESAEGVPGDMAAASEQGLDVVTGKGLLRLIEVQKPGARRQPVADFLRGLQVARKHS
jgi:methionyl-tRNA formyltransferase